MRLACVSPTDQGICAGLSRRGTVPSCVSGSIMKFPKVVSDVPWSHAPKSPQHFWLISGKEGRGLVWGSPAGCG
eukprot:3766965-Prymnesium_polylepis.1